MARPVGSLTGTRSPFWVSIGLRDGRAVGVLPAALTRNEWIREVVDFPGLRLMRVDPLGSRRGDDVKVETTDGPDR